MPKVKAHAQTRAGAALERAKGLDAFVDRIRGIQPDFFPTVEGKVVCLTPTEESLVLLASLAKRKWELSETSAAGYEPWESSYFVWEREGERKALQGRMHAVNAFAEHVRNLPGSVKVEWNRRYCEYLIALYDLTGDGRDHIPEDMWLLVAESNGHYEKESVARARRALYE
jgi:hypothetical protein